MKEHSKAGFEKGSKDTLRESEVVTSRKEKETNLMSTDRGDDLDTCVETDIGTDLGTDFVNVFFQKKQALKEKQKIKEKESRAPVTPHLQPFSLVNDSEDDFTVVTALQSVAETPKELNAAKSNAAVNVAQRTRNKVPNLLTSEDEDTSGDFNVFTKPRQRKKSKLEEEEDKFNEEFEVKSSRKADNEPTSRTAHSFFEEVDARFKSSVKESTDFQEQNQQLVKACPECGEVNKVYVTWCVECGGVLSEVKPVPFIPKKSHTPREVTRPVASDIPKSAAQESFQVKLENSFNGPSQSSLKKKQIFNVFRNSEDQESTDNGNVRDSDNFEYEPMESSMRSLPDPLKRALSLDLRTSTDSSAVASSNASGALAAQGATSNKKSAIKRPGVHNELFKMSERMDFVYNEAVSPKKSFPHALQKELSLELSADSDSTTVNRMNKAGKHLSFKPKFLDNR